MICQRSGLCCTSMGVIIRVDDRLRWKPENAICPHLTFEGTQASCGVHDEPWYKDMPCFAYGNPDVDPDYEVKRGRPCPVGALIQSKGGLHKLRLAVIPHATPRAEDLRDLGPAEE